MSTPVVKLIFGTGLTCWLAGCSSMTGGSMVSSLNPFSGPKTFSNLSEPPIDGKTAYAQDELVEADNLSEPGFDDPALEDATAQPSSPTADFDEAEETDSFVTAELDDWEASSK